MSEWIQNILISVIGAIIGGLITLLIEHYKEKHKNKIEFSRKMEEAFKNRPEIEIVNYKNYFSRVGYGIKQKTDIEAFVAPIKNITVTGDGKNAQVNAHYFKDDFDATNWCCVIYTFKNAGKTNISTLDIISCNQKSTCIFTCGSARKWAEKNLLNYNICYDKKIRVNDTLTVKLCYHKDSIIDGRWAASIDIGMIDDNGLHWTQPLFAPANKVYDSHYISAKNYMQQIRVDIAEEYFKNSLTR